MASQHQLIQALTRRNVISFLPVGSATPFIIAEAIERCFDHSDDGRSQIAVCLRESVSDALLLATQLRNQTSLIIGAFVSENAAEFSTNAQILCMTQRNFDMLLQQELMQMNSVSIILFFDIYSREDHAFSSVFDTFYESSIAKPRVIGLLQTKNIDPVCLDFHHLSSTLYELSLKSHCSFHSYDNTNNERSSAQILSTKQSHDEIVLVDFFRQYLASLTNLLKTFCHLPSFLPDIEHPNTSLIDLMYFGRVMKAMKDFFRVVTDYKSELSQHIIFLSHHISAVFELLLEMLDVSVSNVMTKLQRAFELAKTRWSSGSDFHTHLLRLLLDSRLFAAVSSEWSTVLSGKLEQLLNFLRSSEASPVILVVSSESIGESVCEVLTRLDSRFRPVVLPVSASTAVSTQFQPIFQSTKPELSTNQYTSIHSFIRNHYNVLLVTADELESRGSSLQTSTELKKCMFSVIRYDALDSRDVLKLSLSGCQLATKPSTSAVFQYEHAIEVQDMQQQDKFISNMFKHLISGSIVFEDIVDLLPTGTLAVESRVKELLCLYMQDANLGRPVFNTTGKSPNIVSTLTMPIESPCDATIIGDARSTVTSAENSAAYKVCMQLYDRKLLQQFCRGQLTISRRLSIEQTTGGDIDGLLDEKLDDNDVTIWQASAMSEFVDYEQLFKPAVSDHLSSRFSSAWTIGHSIDTTAYNDILSTAFTAQSSETVLAATSTHTCHNDDMSIDLKGVHFQDQTTKVFHCVPCGRDFDVESSLKSHEQSFGHRRRQAQYNAFHNQQNHGSVDFTTVALDPAIEVPKRSSTFVAPRARRGRKPTLRRCKSSSAASRRHSSRTPASPPPKASLPCSSLMVTSSASVSLSSGLLDSEFVLTNSPSKSQRSRHFLSTDQSVSNTEYYRTPLSPGDARAITTSSSSVMSSSHSLSFSAPSSTSKMDTSSDVLLFLPVGSSGSQSRHSSLFYGDRYISPSTHPSPDSPQAAHLLNEYSTNSKNAVSQLYELSAKNDITPKFVDISRTGSSHCPEFVVEVHYKNYVGRGVSGSKKLAKHAAAVDVLKQIRCLK